MPLLLLLLLIQQLSVNVKAYSYSTCTLPLNYCAHLNHYQTLTPIQNQMLQHIQTTTSSSIAITYQSPSSPSLLLEPIPTIPNIVHFVFGLGDQRADFHYAYFINVVATALVLHPTHIYMHYATEPTGEWWKEVQPLLHLIKYNLDDTKRTFGIYLKHYAHRADVVRLDALIKYGGIYLDLDALPLQSFDNLREIGVIKGALMGAEKIIDEQAAKFTTNRNHYIMVSHFHEHLKKRRNGQSIQKFDKIMNKYKNNHWKIWEEFQTDYNYNFLYEDKCRDAESNEFAKNHPQFKWWKDYEYLCNAVMMSVPDSTFMKVWLDRYKYFNDTCWNCHSVWLPTHLARNIMPENIHMLENHYPKSTFFSPGWHREDLEMLYGSGTYDFSNSYAMHMWFSSAKRIYGLEEKIQPKYFVVNNQKGKSVRGRKEWSTYQQMVRKVIPIELLHDMYVLKEKKGKQKQKKTTMKRLEPKKEKTDSLLWGVDVPMYR